MTTFQIGDSGFTREGNPYTVESLGEEADTLIVESCRNRYVYTTSGKWIMWDGDTEEWVIVEDELFDLMPPGVGLAEMKRSG